MMSWSAKLVTVVKTATTVATTRLERTKLRFDKERFVNARAEDYWTLRELFEQGEIDIDPDDDQLAARLGSIKWGIDSRGRIKMNRRTRCATAASLHPIGPMPWPWRSLVGRMPRL